MFVFKRDMKTEKKIRKFLSWYIKKYQKGYIENTWYCENGIRADIEVHNMEHFLN